MTNKFAKAKLALARSWIAPPQMKVTSPGFDGKGYDQRQRAYQLKCTQKGSQLKLKLSGSGKSPVHNPAFVIEGWGQDNAELTINGKVIPWGKDARIGHRCNMDDCDLIVWLKFDSTENTYISLKPAKS